MKRFKNDLAVCLGAYLLLAGALVPAASAQARLGAARAATGAASAHLARHPSPAHLHRVRTAGARTSIIGGSPAAQGTWQFMAFVVHYDSSGSPDFDCSGTLISSNVVLTAGHCGLDETTGDVVDPSGYRVVTASVNWTDASLRQISSVARVIVYPYYNPAAHDRDAALLQLSTPTSAPAVRLATGSDLALTAPGTGAYIAGWGDTYYGSGPALNLQWATTVVQSANYCGQHWADFDAGSEVCALDYPYESAGVCNGDSGGPLVAGAPDGTPVEIGITSFGALGCDTTAPQVFTRTDQLSAWANGWAQTLAPPPPSPPSSPAPPAPSAPAPLPNMRSADARSYVRQTLAGVFRARFRRGHRYRASCSRRNAIRFRCRVTWWYGPNDYWGSVTVHYVRGSAGNVEWTDSYAINRVNDRCYYHSKHRSRCHKYSRRGSY